jgi:hypothetical protein
MAGVLTLPVFPASAGEVIRASSPTAGSQARCLAIIATIEVFMGSSFMA